MNKESDTNSTSQAVLKILHVAPAYYPAVYWGGPTFSVYALNNALAALPNVSLTILTTDTAGPRLSDRLDSGKVAHLYENQEVLMTRRVAGLSVSMGLLMVLPKLVRRANVVHLTSTYSFPTIPTLVLCYLYNKALVWSPRGAIQDAYEWEGAPRKRLKLIWEGICNALIRPGRVVTHTTSERERVATQERLPRATAVIVPNGVAVPDMLPQRVWLPDGRLRLMYLGRLSPKKGIENLLHAVVLTDDSTVSLTIYGTGDADYVASLEELASQLGVHGKTVFFGGHVDGEAKASAFHTADVCVVPSHTENFCMVVAEALAHGVPVIASRGTPWAELENNKCGLWVSNSPESLAQAIARIRVMELAEMGLRGRVWMAREFSWDALAQEMVDIYKSLAPC